RPRKPRRRNRPAQSQPPGRCRPVPALVPGVREAKSGAAAENRYASESLLRGYLRLLQFIRFLRRFDFFNRFARFQRNAGESWEIGTVSIRAKERVPHDRTTWTARGATRAATWWSAWPSWRRTARGSSERTAPAKVFTHFLELLLLVGGE